jgi:WD40 repeat protein
LASGGNTGSVIVWNMTTGVIHRTWSDQAALVRCLAFAPDGQTLAMAGDDRVIRFGDLASGESRVAPKGLPSVAFALRFAPHGKTLTTCGYDRRLKTWLVATAQLKSTIRLEPYQSEYDFPACMSFSIDGQLLAWGLKDNTARLWETATAKERHVLRGHEAAVTAVGFSPDGKAFCTGSRDRTAKLWNVASGKLLATLAGHRHTVQTVAFHPTGNLLATGSADGAVKLWDLRTLGELAVLQGHSKAVQAVAFAPDGRTLATAGMEGVVQLWNIAEME